MNYVILYKLASATVRPIDESGLTESRNTCEEIVSQDPVLSILEFSHYITNNIL